MKFRSYLVLSVLVSLLFWGPIDHSYKYWWIIRFGYLIVIPVLLWFILEWIWHKVEISENTEVTLERVLFSFISFIFFLMAYIQGTAKSHWGNTKWAVSRDDIEPIGEDILVPGPDRAFVFILIIVGALFLWFGVIRKNLNGRNK